MLEGNNIVLPSNVLVSETIDKTVSKVERLLEVSSLGNNSRFLSLGLSELCLEFVYFSNDFSDLFFDNSKFFTLLFG